MTVDEVGWAIESHLNEIADYFKPGVKLTFLARRPDHEDGSQDMVLTNDDLAAAITALQIRQQSEAAR